MRSKVLCRQSVLTEGVEPSGHVTLDGRLSPQGHGTMLFLSKTLLSGQVMLVGRTPAPQGFLDRDWIIFGTTFAHLSPPRNPLSPAWADTEATTTSPRIA